MHFQRKLFNIINIEIGYVLIPFTFRDFSKSGDSDQESSFTYTVFVLLWEKLEEVTDCRRPVEGFFETHLWNQ